jgi:DMSO/TMAO reductase YedYZ molybdopterin-dependent catalytic subunit
MATPNPFFDTARRPHTEGLYQEQELRLANRNSGILLEALRHDLTPIGLHYLLNHFDVPQASAETWRLELAGSVRQPRALTLDDIKRLPARTLAVTLECAGNGRGSMRPRYPSMPWLEEAVGTAEWTGTPLLHVLDRAGLLAEAVEIAFIGADRGFDRGQEHVYGRSLPVDLARSEDVLVVWAMNGAPLLPQHGFPLRLIVPGWYGMASVKWLARIEALPEPFQGVQQVGSYQYRASEEAMPVPVTHMRVRSLLVPPGIPDWYTRRRMVDAGAVSLFGRAWSGAGVPVVKVEVGIDEAWREAELTASVGKYAWRGWQITWDARPGDHVLSCRATDANGQTQPLEARWDMGGFGNNAVQRVQVTVR